ILLRHFGFGGAIGLNRRLRGGKRRIEIIEVAPIDARRRLVLVRRDDKEHLILLGMHDDILVEGGITPPESDKMPDSDPPSIDDSVRFGIKSFAASTRGTRK
ncbi:MAG: flagellar biosynthetic protein FliO, partial [Rickettsiales bacterium]